MEKITVPAMSPRKPQSHKGDYGKVLVIAGSATMIGAPAIVGTAALRAGSGLCRIATIKEILPHVLTICPWATGFAWGGRDTKEIIDFAEQHDAVAIGPGLGQSPAVKKLVLDLLHRHAGPVVLDADALNTLAALQDTEWPKRRNWGNVVMTPHMGEFMRLMSAVMKRGGVASQLAAGADPANALAAGGQGKAVTSMVAAETLMEEAEELEAADAPSTADGVALEFAETEPAASASAPSAPAASGQPDHSALAELLSKATGAVVVLKGHRTVVTDGHRFFINTTGNAGMATAGSGDVLTGVIASLLGQKFAPLEAAALGVHLHGSAGDIAAKEIGPAGLVASDIAQAMPKAIKAHMSKA